MAIMLATAVAVLASSATPKSNMNGGGPYVISNDNPRSETKYDTNFYTKNAEYFDVYAGPISTRYGEVFWRGLPAAPLPDDLLKRFDNKTMAIIGYEQDQVVRHDDGSPDTPVPITMVYNHHYVSWLKGKSATMVDLGDGPHPSRGHPLQQDAVCINDPNPDSVIPTSQFFSEGNGGESRKSYHGYPHGFAQLIDSPTEFVMTPMQIDTWNRNTSFGSKFVPGPEPAASQSPPDAIYSGHLECPCTDRIKKHITETFSTQYTGKCNDGVRTSEACFSAAAQVGVDAARVVRNVSATSSSLPAGCSFENVNGSVTFTFNNHSSDRVCGSANGAAVKLTGTLASYITFGLELDPTVAGGLATITLTGPADVWFGVGLGATVMADKPNAIIVSGNGTVFEQKLADQSIGHQLPTSIKIVSNTVSNGNRTVVVTRAFKGLTPDHYTFDLATSQLNFLNAIGRGPVLAYHQARASATLSLQALGVPTCVCSTGVQGFISSDMNPSPAKFSKHCAPEPYSDLIQDHNPTCFVDTYVGGLKCCTSGNILLDSHQNPWADNKLTYYMKFRFWFQEYTPPTPTAPASHENLVRFFHETEVGSGEYDVVKAPEGTAPEDTVYTITSHFQLKNAVSECNPRTSPHCTGPMTSGIMMRYASCHCHAPSCLSCELYNADTGDLICRQIPVTGNASHATADRPYDEKGYIAVPPCIYGPEEEGLLAPPFIAYDQNLTSIKKNNNTYGHYGEMAMWQCRGSQAYQP